jgi:CheY-like chemotaxis protein
MMLTNRRVLLADDDIEVRSGVEDLLSPLGLEVLHAETGPQALEIARERLEQLHLLVLDFHMPGCNGLDVFTSLRASSVGLRMPPCIFYSGEATELVRSKALDLGAWAFLRKPVQPDELRNQVMRALRHAV